eukprot:6470230-Amphidinium_carterae.1
MLYFRFVSVSLGFLLFEAFVLKLTVSLQRRCVFREVEVVCFVFVIVLSSSLFMIWFGKLYAPYVFLSPLGEALSVVLVHCHHIEKLDLADNIKWETNLEEFSKRIRAAPCFSTLKDLNLSLCMAVGPCSCYSEL